MLYLGFFSCDTESETIGKGESTFTLLVDANSPDDAGEKFKSKLLSGFEEDSGLTDDIEKVFLDGIIELEKIPQDVAMVNYVHKTIVVGDPCASINNMIPAGRDGMDSFMWGDEDEDDRDGVVDRVPFIIMDEL